MGQQLRYKPDEKIPFLPSLTCEQNVGLAHAHTHCHSTCSFCLTSCSKTRPPQGWWLVHCPAPAASHHHSVAAGRNDRTTDPPAGTCGPTWRPQWWLLVPKQIADEHHNTKPELCGLSIIYTIIRVPDWHYFITRSHISTSWLAI